MDRTRDIRREYAYAELRRADLAEQPLDQFKSWLDHALTKAVPDATAMALATADDQGMPSVRIVLLKDFNADGFVWFSDQRSEKGRALAANPYAELLFHWRELDRQVRIRGLVHLLSEQAADDYFNSRQRSPRVHDAFRVEYSRSRNDREYSGRINIQASPAQQLGAQRPFRRHISRRWRSQPAQRQATARWR